MKKKRKKHYSDAEVATFWDRHDATEVLDLSEKKRVNVVYEPPV